MHFSIDISFSIETQENFYKFNQFNLSLIKNKTYAFSSFHPNNHTGY